MSKNENSELTLPSYCSKYKLFDNKHHISILAKLPEQWH